MFDEDDIGLMREALDTVGADQQVTIFMTELAELIQALAHLHRGKANLEKLAEELADVEIMIAQLHMIHPALERFLRDALRRRIERMRIRLHGTPVFRPSELPGVKP